MHIKDTRESRPIEIRAHYTRDKTWGEIPTSKAATAMSLLGDEGDEGFLLAVDAAEAKALDFSKRRCLSTTPMASSSPPLAAAPEGPYLAALKGSHNAT
ncbi:hypothetical protein GUJ93_ZPchr0013g36869 [Zizania palustris]|uniref:Uncharacterized protein n=1 Tax=Zizania palustris TaxID=103762 RepID=A0A8J6BWF6_ZIZPA|nr:hypothetical protein GUJ93_ZPchr0013g36869 [Zizania palustris]